jgi:hypothetical protein
MKLLTYNNAKTIKGEKYGYTTAIMYLSPHKQNSRGVNICPKASPACIEACLNTAGRGAFNSVQLARYNRTELFVNNRALFFDQLYTEVRAAKKKYGEGLCIRLNGTSDIIWERLPGCNIFTDFNDIQFYDYTKVSNRFLEPLPSNYYLTFSRSEVNEQEAQMLLNFGHNVAVVFDQLPDTYMGAKVIEGDETDLRFLDERGVIVGLTAKGKAKKDNTGFVVRTQNI